jgi:hypothetical protein
VGAGTNNVAGSGQNNAFSGYQAGFNNTNGHSNTFAGYQAGLNNSSGNGNTFLGASAGTHNNTGQNNIFVGNQAGFASESGGNSDIYIGSQGSAESNTIRIGSVGTQTARLHRRLSQVSTTRQSTAMESRF